MADMEAKCDYPYLLSTRTRFLNFVFKGARPLGMSWKEFNGRREQREIALAATRKLPGQAAG
ncbi:hypothetical protein HYPDE_41228 [Hyphomicrobium denitrificans 1NES1]|uniref:Uncharacterized protein n=1 Tax=Hyphomicrobium denitrificans 1NES1 TaxID=670307 RepID=N0B8G8_9HYPH|nr:hypothetical protein HYPDE_41228 [Hyphomicrobium denitrificans 1NES1]